jgi:hypothetical protein
MQGTKLETIQTENLENVTGGGWLDMLSGGKHNIGSMLGGASEGGGAFGLNKDGQGKSLSEGISGLLGFGGGGPIKTVEGKDHQGFGG